MATHSVKGFSKLFGILGNPIQHSLSPIIHNILLKHPDYSANFGVYLPLQCKESNLKTVLQATQSLSFVGLNVTSPYKEKVIPFINKLSPLSKSIQSVNTIYWENDICCGTSTDGLGFIRGFEREKYSFDQKTVAILGTGGVSRAIIQALTTQNCEDIFVFSRKQKKGTTTSFHNAPTFSYNQYSDFQKQINVVVNCTPLGMGNDVRSPLLHESMESHQCFYDLIYGKKTPFLKYASQKNAQTINGLSMLIYQAISSFKIWTKINEVNEEEIFDQVNLYLKQNS